jgi:hypothetical protein
MTASLDSEAKIRLTAHLPVRRQKSVNFEPAGHPLRRCPPQETDLLIGIIASGPSLGTPWRPPPAALGPSRTP